MTLESPKSTNPRKMAIIITSISTTEVEATVSFLVGQTTFFSSTFTSLKNCVTFSSMEHHFRKLIVNSIRTVATSFIKKMWQARRDSNPHHPDLESGALAVGATGLFC